MEPQAGVWNELLIACDTPPILIEELNAPLIPCGPIDMELENALLCPGPANAELIAPLNPPHPLDMLLACAADMPPWENAAELA